MYLNNATVKSIPLTKMQKKEEKMYSALLVIIYLAFISLGLPDTLLGSAWPQMHIELNASLSSAGIITMIISIKFVFRQIKH